MNDDERKGFADAWNSALDQIEPLSISSWLRAYVQLDDTKDSDRAKGLILRINGKLEIAANTIDELRNQLKKANK